MINYTHIFHGTSFSSYSPKKVNILENHLFFVNSNGMIEKIVGPDHEDYTSLVATYERDANYYRLKDGQYFLPGFIDLHVHAPQWAQNGTALDIPLYDWLHTYTFPLESKYADLKFATKVYEDLVSALLANGTTTVLYFATVHKEASFISRNMRKEGTKRVSRKSSDGRS